MKLISLLFTGFCLLFCKPIQAQDKITDLNGNEYLVNITEITPDSVLFKEIADPVNPKVYSIHKHELFMVIFKNGSKEILLEKPQAAQALATLSKQDYYKLGQLDARQNFKSKGAFWGTFAATFTPVVYPFGGIVAGTAISLADPNDRNVVARSPEYKKDVNYMLGYNNQAKKKKLASAAGGFGAALGVSFIVIAAAFAGAF